jgi:DNA processing protein
MLSARIEHATRDPSRLLDLLQLTDEELIAAIGGRRKQELIDRRLTLLAEQRQSASAATLCSHSPLHQRVFGDRLALRGALHILGDPRRLRRLRDDPVVAILGTTRASDYGMEMAAWLARRLSRCGVTVISSFTAGIGAAVHLGVLEAGAAPLAVMPCGVDAQPARLARLHRRLVAGGAAISELPEGFRSRRWSGRACERILAALANLVVVIEADIEETGMLAASLAAGNGIAVAAMPGRITSPAARGPHALLRKGATLLASVEDALGLLHRVCVADGITVRKDDRIGLTRQAVSLLEDIGAKEDTLQSICDGPQREQRLIALSELRCKGLLSRGDGGRYLPRVSLDIGRSDAASAQRGDAQAQPGEKQGTVTGH